MTAEMEKRILAMIKESDLSLTIEEVSAKAQIHRITAAKYLAVLEARGVLQHRTVGSAKLYSLAKKQGKVL